MTKIQTIKECPRCKSETIAHKGNEEYLCRICAYWFKLNECNCTCHQGYLSTEQPAGDHLKECYEVYHKTDPQPDTNITEEKTKQSKSECRNPDCTMQTPENPCKCKCIDCQFPHQPESVAGCKFIVGHHDHKIGGNCDLPCHKAGIKYLEAKRSPLSKDREATPNLVETSSSLGVEWEKEFDEFWEKCNDVYNCDPSKNEVKDFIHSLLSQQKTDIKERIEKMETHSGHKDLVTGREWTDKCCLIDNRSITRGWGSHNYNKALDDVLSYLKEP